MNGWCQTCGATEAALCPHGYCPNCHADVCVSEPMDEPVESCEPHWSEPLGVFK